MKIFLWKLGSLEQKIFPTKAAIENFKQVLSQLKDDKLNHIVWGPDIDVKIIEIEDISEVQHVIEYFKKGQHESTS